MTQEEILCLRKDLHKKFSYEIKAMNHMIANVTPENKHKLFLMILIRAKYCSELVFTMGKLKEEYYNSCIGGFIKQLPTYNQENDIKLTDSERIVNIR
jgi:hypothetical protein